jgi:hypothetical protein
MARKAATLLPPTMARVRVWSAARRARTGAATGGGPAGAAEGVSNRGTQGLDVVDGSAGAVGRGTAGTAVDDGSITGPDPEVGGDGGSAELSGISCS